VTWGTAAVLLLLAIAVLAFPDSLPGFVVPGGGMDGNGGGRMMMGG
jgi:hypothetical protein